MLSYLLAALESEEDKRRFTELYEENHVRAEQTALRILRDPHDAEDAVQDAFIRILNMGDMVCVATIRNLAFTVVQNILVDRLRGRVRKAEAYSYMYDFRSEASDEMEQKIHAQSLVENEHVRMKALPLACRNVYYLNRFREKSAEEIAQQLHVSRRTVQAQIQKGRMLVRAYLKAVGEY